MCSVMLFVCLFSVSLFDFCVFSFVCLLLFIVVLFVFIVSYYCCFLPPGYYIYIHSYLCPTNSAQIVWGRETLRRTRERG